MKPILDAALLAVMLNMETAINLYRAGGFIGLLSGAGSAILTIPFTANLRGRKATRATR